MSAVTVVDYGLGNLHSVINALNHLGATVSVAENGEAVLAAERLIVPGVGAFADGMAGLSRRDQVSAIRRFAASGRPLAGICLGAQLLLGESDEFGRHQGLGIIPGRVVMIPTTGVKVPHVGWNRLTVPEGGTWAGSALAGTPGGTWTYFVHSFHMVPDHPEHLLAVTRHGPHAITAAVRMGNVTGFQFHPEKSGRAGLTMLRTFLNQER